MAKQFAEIVWFWVAQRFTAAVTALSCIGLFSPRGRQASARDELKPDESKPPPLSGSSRVEGRCSMQR